MTGTTTAADDDYHERGNQSTTRIDTLQNQPESAPQAPEVDASADDSDEPQQPQPQQEHTDETHHEVVDNDQQQEPDEDEDPPIELYKSTRFKGYLTIALASVINQNAAALSNDPAYVNAVPAAPSQQKYAQAVSIVSAIIAGFAVICHLDRYSRLQKRWHDLFAPKSKIELAIIGFLLVWWSVATIIQTGVRGIAGDGKEQYNLYCSTWLCCYTCGWTMERKLLEFGYPTVGGFVTSWPYRAPGWIAIFSSCFFTLFWYVDLFINTAKFTDRVAEPLKPFYSNIPKSQYQWLLLVASVTLLPSGVFIAAELLRESNDFVVKGHLELVLEGFCLFLLAASWIPSVIAATTPGGFASLIGNAYFFTWATTIFVVETFVWFIHDFRGNVHKALMEKEAEYKRHQQEVLKKSRQYTTTTTTTATTRNQEELRLAGGWGSSSGGGNGNDNENYDDDDDSVAREIRLKESNSDVYFQTLDDILE
jgi:hypothetical protein